MSGRDNPFSDIEQLFDQLTQFEPTASTATAVDIAEEDDAFVVVVDLPGFTSEDIDVQLDDERTLRISGERDTEEHVEDGTFVKRERHHEQVNRTISLPGPVDTRETEANYENGVLTVRLGKQTESDDGTDIPVN